MIVYVATKSAGRFGGNTTFTFVGRYIESGLTSYGGGLNQLEVTACFRGGRVRHTSLLPSHEEYHRAFLPTLPLVKLFRKKGRIEIQYATEIADASFLERYGFLSVEIFAAVLREVGDALHLLDSKLRKTDGFDITRLHDDVGKLVATAPTSEEHLRSLKAALERKEQERRAAMDPWELLDIDWDEFHPQARQILDQPFLWFNTDGYAPHGNDTGADLLSDFKKWNRRNPNKPAVELVNALLRAWDMRPIDLSAVDEERVRELLERDAIAVSVTDDAIIAAAFAAVKFRGFCDPETKRLAVAALAREQMATTMRDRGWKDPAERLRTLAILSAALDKSSDVSGS